MTVDRQSLTDVFSQTVLEDGCRSRFDVLFVGKGWSCRK